MAVISATVGASAQARRARAGARLRLLTLCGAAGALALVNLYGLPYYTAPLSTRVRHPLHPLLRPSGLVGQSLGIIVFAMFLFLWLYPLRKRLGSRAAFAGAVGSWLDWHIVSGLLIPWIAATHASWRFTGLIGMGYAAMFVVYLSGLVGRYLYARIPRRLDGVELTRDEIAAERERLLFELTAETRLPPQEVRQMLAPDLSSTQRLGPLATLVRLVADDRARRRAARRLAAHLRAPRAGAAKSSDAGALQRALALARREMALTQQMRMLDATQRLFKYWHAAHKPVAITALVAVLAHVAVAVAVGATWFR
jgi:hypothetical protein